MRPVMCAFGDGWTSAGVASWRYWTEVLILSPQAGVRREMPDLTHAMSIVLGGIITYFASIHGQHMTTGANVKPGKPIWMLVGSKQGMSFRQRH